MKIDQVNRESFKSFVQDTDSRDAGKKRAMAIPTTDDNYFYYCFAISGFYDSHRY